MLVDYITDLIGTIPTEIDSPDMVVWVIGAFVLIFLLVEVFAFLHNIFRSFLGG